MTVESAAPASVMASPPRRRAILGWIAIGVVVLAFGGVGAWLAGLSEWAQRGALDPDSAGPAGTRAIVSILRDQGIDVVVTGDRATAGALLADRAATLALPDAPALSDDALSSLAAGAADLVLLAPRSRTLALFLPGSTLEGTGGGSAVDPACPLAEAVRSGAVSPGAVYAPGDGATACYPSGTGFGLLVGDDDGRRVAAFDARALIANDVLADDGGAALGLNLLGRHDTVVWYVPSVSDSDLADADPSLGDLTPPWVSPVIVLLLTAGAAAAIWRGRRFGPLVAERLPVTVRASETAEGRARLYAHARDAAHAADQLRLGCLDRLARLVGLGPAADAGAVADAVAAVCGWDARAVRAILIDDVPAADADLVALDERLRHLERAVRTAVRQEGNTP